MPFNAKLELDGNNYRILSCSYHLDRDFDQFGKPSSEIRGGTITVTIETTGVNTFSAWMMSSRLRKSGRIIFDDPIEDAELKAIEFEEAYMVFYEESFASQGQGSMSETFKISAKKLTISDASHENDWYK